MSVDILIFTDVAKVPYARAAGAYRIATELRAHGFTVQVADHFTYLARGGLDRVLRVVDKFVGRNTLFVGFSTTFFDIEHAPRGAARNLQIPLRAEEMRDLVARVKTRNPRAKIVAGGAKAGLHGGELIDAFIPGYADSSVIEYARYLKGENPFFQFSSLQGGKVLIDKDQRASRFEFRKSRIAWDPEDLVSPREILPIEISRGCIFKCKFCSFPLNGRRNDLAFVKDRDSLYRELMDNYERYGTTSYIFADDTFNDSVEKVAMLAELFARLPFRLRYTAYIRHDLIWKHREMAELLEASGLVSATFGIETLNHAAGKAIGKGLHPDKTRELLHWLRDEKWGERITTFSGFIIGLPHDTPETVERWAGELLDPDFPLHGFRFSPLLINRDAKRFHLSEFELDSETYGYRFTDPCNPMHWESDGFTRESAVDMVGDVMLQAEDSGRNRLGGFVALMLENLGYSWEEVGKMTMSDTNSRKALRRRLKLVDGYYDRLIR